MIVAHYTDPRTDCIVDISIDISLHLYLSGERTGVQILDESEAGELIEMLYGNMPEFEWDLAL